MPLPRKQGLRIVIYTLLVLVLGAATINAVWGHFGILTANLVSITFVLIYRLSLDWFFPRSP